MSLKKDLAILGGLVLVVVSLLIFGRGFTTTSFINPPKEATATGKTAAGQTASGQSQVNNKPQVIVRGLTVFAEVAKTREQRQKGLSKRDSLPFNEAMLFVFERSGNYAIWMKDMKFPIDIVWIDNSPNGDKKVVDIAQNAVPEPGKDDNELRRYVPKSDALYILEINAGLVRANDLQVGDVVSFEL